MRGADGQLVFLHRDGDEPSPRARGRHQLLRVQVLPLGTIPACAGPTIHRRRHPIQRRNHPRVRGADSPFATASTASVEPSPRARGRRQPDSCGRWHGGTIPACAGPTMTCLAMADASTNHPACAGPTPCSPFTWISWANHPRVRGADGGWLSDKSQAPEPSPRARGRRHAGTSSPWESRTIPACAGPTATRPRKPLVAKNHPRVRGADFALGTFLRSRAEPSPRARGRLRPTRSRGAVCRTIPTCAGPTTTTRTETRTGRNHPRVRGADARHRVHARRGEEPSPRARGRPWVSHAEATAARTIPACAGPTAASRHGPGPTDRDRGAARSATNHPRVRGADRAGSGLPPPGPGTIPACAGPTSGALGEGAEQANHPRVRGADWPNANGPAARGEPSPRARGRPAAVRRGRCVRGTIPACAGPTLLDLVFYLGQGWFSFTPDRGQACSLVVGFMCSRFAVRGGVGGCGRCCEDHLPG